MLEKGVSPMKKHISWSKKNKVVIILTFIVVFGLWMIWGNTTIQVSHFTITDSEIPESFDGFKIAHVSDLQNKEWSDEQLIQPMREEKPDMIVITGDLIDYNHTDIVAATSFLEKIENIAPIYFVTGNHEGGSIQYPLLEEKLLELDITMLDNNKLTLNKNNEQILLMGIQDPSFYEESNVLKGHEAIMENEIQKLSENDLNYKILLSHRPEYFDVYVRTEIDLVLSGHAHGGQFRLPFLGGLVAPGQGFFPEFTSGVYEEENTKMLVSRGVGDSMIPVRFNNRAELVFVELENGE